MYQNIPKLYLPNVQSAKHNIRLKHRPAEHAGQALTVPEILQKNKFQRNVLFPQTASVPRATPPKYNGAMRQNLCTNSNGIPRTSCNSMLLAMCSILEKSYKRFA